MRFRRTIRQFAALSMGAAALLVSAAALADLPCPYSQPIGLIGHAQSVGNYAIGIDVQGNYAYVGDWNQGSYHAYAGVFQAFDVTAPCNPTRLPGSVETTYPGYNEIGDLAVHGTRAYLANDGNGFAVYDISDPTNPVMLDRRSDATYAHSVFYDGGDYAYVGYGWSVNRELAIYDVSTLPLAAPVIYPTGTGGLHDVYVAGGRAYLFSGQQLDIVDVIDPLHPVGISSLALPQNQYGVEGEVRVQGNHAYMAMGDAAQHFGGLRVVDVSDDNNPALIASYDVPGGAGKMYAKGIGLAVAGDRAYIAARGGLWVFDVSVPNTPMLLDNFPLPAAFTNSMGAHVEVRDNLAYVTAYGSVGGLAIYKVYELPYPVAIDVKPGSFPNSINLGASGVIPVAILSTPTFSAPSEVNPDTLTLAGAKVRVAGKSGKFLCSLQDVNGDVAMDLVCHFENELNPQLGDSIAVVEGETYSGVAIRGEDSIRIVQE